MVPSDSEIAQVLESLGCPPAQCPDMAGQLCRRARQLSETTGRTPEEALTHLLRLMSQGWAAQSRTGS